MIETYNAEFKEVDWLVEWAGVYITHTSWKDSWTFSASSKQAFVPAISKANRRIDSGAGDRAKGYSLGSLFRRLRGGLMRMGGKDVVVVVVVVTTVVWVAGAYFSCPSVVKGSTIGFCALLEFGLRSEAEGAVVEVMTHNCEIRTREVRKKGTGQAWRPSLCGSRTGSDQA